MPGNEHFHCARCGECCRHIDSIPQLSNFDRGDGVCIHLKDNLCDIYSSRPDICNVEVMYEKHFKDKYSREEFYRLNTEVCNVLMNGESLKRTVFENAERSRSCV